MHTGLTSTLFTRLTHNPIEVEYHVVFLLPCHGSISRLGLRSPPVTISNIGALAGTTDDGHGAVISHTLTCHT